MIDNNAFKLTIEQEFALKIHQAAVEQLEAPQLRLMVVELTRQMMVKDNVLKDYIHRHGV